MAVRPVVYYGNPLLHEVSKPVEEINDEILELVDDMFETMIVNKGIGLAAPQVGVLKRVITIDLGEHDDDISLMTLINPEIVELRGNEIEFEEGCLSIPNVAGNVIRPEELTVRYTDKDGDEYELECSGLLARVVQHEFDHLEGILFPQRMTESERKKIAPALKRIARGEIA